MEICKSRRGDYKNSNNSPWCSDNNKDFLNLLRDQLPTGNNSLPINKELIPINNFAISFDELHKVIHSKNRYSAGGVDLVTYKMLKALPDEALNNVRTALNDVFITNQMPENWRTIKIVPIPKKDKDLNIYSNYRPIALISVFLKCINLCIKDRISHFFEENNIAVFCI